MIDKLNNIVNNSMDIIISSVKIGVSYTLDKVNEIKSVYFVESNTDKDDKDYIWNGGETFRIDDDENTETPYDDVVINYDGIMEEVDE
tara:strand:- start:142 stop:405 length:264 start_codon:yes stop_codon:yes gene_type:complete